MKKRIMLVVLLVVMVVLMLSACAAGDGTYSAERPAGFWWGIWHGMILPFVLIGKIFGAHVGIYEPFNTGLGYDIGFFIGIGGLTGSSARATKRHN